MAYLCQTVDDILMLLFNDTFDFILAYVPFFFKKKNKVGETQEDRVLF